MYGLEITELAASVKDNLSRSMAAGLWADAPGSRSRTVLFEVLAHGHRIDPEAAIPFRRIMTWMALMTKDGNPGKRQELRRRSIRLKELYDEQPDKANQLAGPIALVLRELRSIGWQWEGMMLTGMMESGLQETWGLLGCYREIRGEMLHALREGIRRKLLTKVAQDRPMFQGMENGVDGEATRALLEDKEIQPFELGVLRSIIAGGEATSERRIRKGMPGGNTKLPPLPGRFCTGPGNAATPVVGMRSMEGDPPEAPAANE